MIDKNLRQNRNSIYHHKKSYLRKRLIILQILWKQNPFDYDEEDY